MQEPTKGENRLEKSKGKPARIFASSFIIQAFRLLAGSVRKLFFDFHGTRAQRRLRGSRQFVILFLVSVANAQKNESL